MGIDEDLFIYYLYGLLIHWGFFKDNNILHFKNNIIK